MSARSLVALYLLGGTLWVLAVPAMLMWGGADKPGHATALIVLGTGLVAVLSASLAMHAVLRRHERTRRELEARSRVQHERLEQILAVSPAVIYACRLDPGAAGALYKVEFVSPNVQALTGHGPQVWEDGAWTRLVHAEDLATLGGAFEQLARQGSWRLEYRIHHADGRLIWVEDSAVLVRDEHGRPEGMIGACRDVTDRRRAEEHARLVAQVFDASDDGIVVTDAENRFVSVNRAFTRITGYEAAEVLGHTPALLRSGRQDRRFYEAMWQELQASGRWEGEIWNRRKSGEVYPEWLRISVVRDTAGGVRQYLAVFTETSAHKAAQAAIERLASYDTLTGLPNRSLLAERAATALQQAARQGTRLVLLHLNVDGFGAINEALGHAAGDSLLVEMGRRLTEALGPEATVCRQGADDFLLLLPHTGTREAAQLALRLTAVTAAPVVLQGQTVSPSVSMGVAEYPENGTDLAQLSQAAEAAVHQAKRDGRNTIRFYSQALQSQVRETLALAHDLRSALERDELELHYQAQFEARTHRLVGSEALVRWRHPQRGLVPPEQFIPIAEESGLIHDIGTWVLRDAVRQNAAWQAQGLPIVPVAVNLSPLQFRHPALHGILQQALTDSGLAPGMLELELTESVAMQDTDFTIATIDRLRAMGVQLSIDDFGTGYSSLGYLRRFAVHKLKIDQSFVRGLRREPQDEAIVATVIGLARRLGLRTLAEGVETDEQLEFLREGGCDEIQGFLFERPVPAQAFSELLRSQPSAA